MQTRLNHPAPKLCLFPVSIQSPLLRLVLFVLFSAVARGDHPPLPLALENPEGPWRLLSRERAFDDGLKLVAVLMPRAAAPARALIFNRSASDSDPVPLPALVDQVIAIVLSAPTTRPETHAAERLGYPGQLTRFEVRATDGAYRCEIFAFATGAERWGILQIIREELTALPSAFASLVAAKPVAAGAVAIAPFRVKADPITSFPLSLKVIPDSNTDRIARILVTEIPSDSSTEKAGVKVGDEILSLDDRAVRSFAQGVGRRSELGLVLIDRPPGTRLTLEIISPGDSAPRRVMLESAKPSGGFRWW